MCFCHHEDTLQRSLIVYFIAVMELLPVNISSADVEKYPEFMKLLKALSRHMTDKGLSVSAQQDISEVMLQGSNSPTIALCIDYIVHSTRRKYIHVPIPLFTYAFIQKTSLSWK